jgi:hypothetical protein
MDFLSDVSVAAVAAVVLHIGQCHGLVVDRDVVQSSVHG